MRRPLVIAAALSGALVLVGCAGTAEPEPTPTPTDPAPAATCAESGPASDAVDVQGALGAEPEVFFDAPLETAVTQRAVVLEGDGDEVEAGDVVSVNLALYNGATGELASTTPFSTSGAGVFVQVGTDRMLPGLVATLLCSTEGSRVVGVLAPEDAFGDAGQPDLGIGPGTTLVYVFDVLYIVGDQAAGEAQPELGSPFPEIEWDADGRPTVTIPDADPPAELKIGLVIKGDGPIVGPDDEFTIHYQGVNWRTGEIFDESWGGAPRSFTNVISGFKKAVVGQTVGSRVVVLIPPEEGYGDSGNPNAGIEGTDTLVFVIDILAVTPPLA